MSTKSHLILLGSCWTFVTVYASAQLSSHAYFGGPETGLLALCLFPSIILLLSTVFTGNPISRWLGVILHLALPMAWLSHIALGAGTFVRPETLTFVALCALVGCATSDLGVAPIASFDQDQVILSELEAAARPVCYDSGGFGALVPCDSGAFKVP